MMTPGCSLDPAGSSMPAARTVTSTLAAAWRRVAWPCSMQHTAMINRPLLGWFQAHCRQHSSGRHDHSWEPLHAVRSSGSGSVGRKTASSSGAGASKAETAAKKPSKSLAPVPPPAWVQQLEVAAPKALPSLARQALDRAQAERPAPLYRSRLAPPVLLGCAPGMAALLELAARHGGSAGGSTSGQGSKAAAGAAADGATAEELIRFASKLERNQQASMCAELAPLLMAATTVPPATATAPPSASTRGGAADDLPTVTAASASGPAGGIRRVPLVFDTETNGTSYGVHRVVDICMMDLSSGMEFNTLVFPGPRHSYYDIMSDEAASIHGITAQRLREPDVPSAEAVSLALGLWLLQRCLAASGGRGAVPLLLAHNARFDMCMLGSLLSLSRLQSGPSWHQLCSCTLAKAKFPQLVSHRLEALGRNILGCTDQQQHRAAPDVYLLRDLLPHLLGLPNLDAARTRLCSERLDGLPGLAPSSIYWQTVHTHLQKYFQDVVQQMLTLQLQAREAVVREAGMEPVAAEASVTVTLPAAAGSTTKVTSTIAPSAATVATAKASSSGGAVSTAAAAVGPTRVLSVAPAPSLPVEPLQVPCEPGEGGAAATNTTPSSVISTGEAAAFTGGMESEFEAAAELLPLAPSRRTSSRRRVLVQALPVADSAIGTPSVGSVSLQQQAASGGVRQKAQKTAADMTLAERLRLKRQLQGAGSPPPATAPESTATGVPAPSADAGSSAPGAAAPSASAPAGKGVSGGVPAPPIPESAAEEQEVGSRGRGRRRQPLAAAQPAADEPAAKASDEQGSGSRPKVTKARGAGSTVSKAANKNPSPVEAGGVADSCEVSPAKAQAETGVEALVEAKEAAQVAPAALPKPRAIRRSKVSVEEEAEAEAAAVGQAERQKPKKAPAAAKPQGPADTLPKEGGGALTASSSAAAAAGKAPAAAGAEKAAAAAAPRKRTKSAETSASGGSPSYTLEPLPSIARPTPAPAAAAQLPAPYASSPPPEWQPCSLDLSTKPATKLFSPVLLQKLRAAGFKSLLQVLMFYPKRHTLYSTTLDSRRLIQDVAVAGSTADVSTKQYGAKCAMLSITIHCPLDGRTLPVVSAAAPAAPSASKGRRSRRAGSRQEEEQVQQGDVAAVAATGASVALAEGVAVVSASIVAPGRWALMSLVETAQRFPKGSPVLLRGTAKAKGQPDLAPDSLEPSWRIFECTSPDLMRPEEFDPALHGTVPVYPARGELKGGDFSDKAKRKGVMSRALGALEAQAEREGREVDPLDALPPDAKRLLREAVLAPPPGPAADSSSLSTPSGSSSSGNGSGGSSEVSEWSAIAEVPSWSQALKEVHQPRGPDSLALARRCLAAAEMVMLQLQLLERRRRLLAARSGGPTAPRCSAPALLQAAQAALPFTLTAGQQGALDEILADMASGPEPMYRLLQGDVGSGKTVVAMLAMLTAACSGRQAVLLAPTEVLAEQHYQKLCELLAQLPAPAGGAQRLSAELLTSSTPARKKKQLVEALADGQCRLLVGTHAVLFVPAFRCLGLMVLDEQHKFGVRQKEAMARLQHAELPHMLSMSATPIPRTTALVQFGDMAISTLREAPPGRKPVETRVLPDTPASREQVFEAVRAELDSGGRAFIVYPLRESLEYDDDMEGGRVGAAPKLDLRSAEKEFKALRKAKAFGKHRAALLHGGMSSEDKAAALASFRSGQTPVLVCTVVIEVGVDVQDASILVVEHAERFGLAQLHQLRGRVGRGSRASKCFLLSSASSGSDAGAADGRTGSAAAPPSPLQAPERLHVLESCHNGFEIAEHDLRLRGAGQVFGTGTRQSGGVDVTDMCQREMARDPGLMEAARKAALLAMEDAAGRGGLPESLVAAAAAFKLAVKRRPRLLGLDEDEGEEGEGEEGSGDETLGMGV